MANKKPVGGDRLNSQQVTSSPTNMAEALLEHMGFEFYEIRDFFLMEAFRFAHEVTQYAMASELFSALLKDYLPNNWEAKFNQENSELEEDEVTNKLGELWSHSQHVAGLEPRSLKLSTELISQDLADM